MKLLSDDIQGIYVWVEEHDENIELSPHFDYENDGLLWKNRIMSDFEVNNVGSLQKLAEFRAIAKIALVALERGRPQIMGALVQEDQDFAIKKLKEFLNEQL